MSGAWVDFEERSLLALRSFGMTTEVKGKRDPSSRREVRPPLCRDDNLPKRRSKTELRRLASLARRVIGLEEILLGAETSDILFVWI
jgi:hypothetical protein